MQDRPTIQELLRAAQAYLEQEVLPNTTGRRQFLARVSANVLAQLGRELAHEHEHDRRAWQGLEDLLGEPRAAHASHDALPEGRDALRGSLVERLDRLCGQIRSGAFDDEGPARERLLALLRQLVRDKLEVTNPALLAADRARGIA